MSKNKWGYAVQPNTFCAIDASTNSLAFALFNTKDGTLGSVGKINFEGHDIYEKVIDAGQKVKAFLDFYNGFEAIIIEHTVFMNSPKTAADLALVQGAILGAAGQSGTKVIGKVSPITWQNYLGNKRLTKEEHIQKLKEVFGDDNLRATASVKEHTLTLDHLSNNTAESIYDGTQRDLNKVRINDMCKSQFIDF